MPDTASILIIVLVLAIGIPLGGGLLVLLYVLWVKLIRWTLRLNEIVQILSDLLKETRELATAVRKDPASPSTNPPGDAGSP